MMEGEGEGYWRTENSSLQCRSNVLECRKALWMLLNHFDDPTLDVLSCEVLFVESRPGLVV